LVSGLPDGIFSNQKSIFWEILEGTAMGDVGICHLVHFTTVWYILWPSGIFYGHLLCFPRLGVLYQEKTGNPGLFGDQSEKTSHFLEGKCRIFFSIALFVWRAAQISFNPNGFCASALDFFLPSARVAPPFSLPMFIYNSFSVYFFLHMSSHFSRERQKIKTKEEGGVEGGGGILRENDSWTA
jgi:hypothetical protein